MFISLLIQITYLIPFDNFVIGVFRIKGALLISLINTFLISFFFLNLIIFIFQIFPFSLKCTFHNAKYTFSSPTKNVQVVIFLHTVARIHPYEFLDLNFKYFFLLRIKYLHIVKQSVSFFVIFVIFARHFAVR